MKSESNLLKKEILKLQIQNKELRTQLAKVKLELKETVKTNKNLIKMRQIAEDEVRRMQGECHNN